VILREHLGPFDTWGDWRGQLTQLEATCLPGEAWDEAQWQQFSLNSLKTATAWMGQKLVGFLVWQPLGPGEAEVIKVGVDPQTRRVGVAKMLLNHLEQSTAPNGRVLLEVRANNTEANGLYQTQGYQKIGVRKSYYRHPVDDALLFEKQT